MSKVIEVFVLSSYERDESGGWKEDVVLFKNPTTEQLAVKIGCSKGYAKALLDGYEITFNGKIYYLVSRVVE